MKRVLWWEYYLLLICLTYENGDGHLLPLFFWPPDCASRAWCKTIVTCYIRQRSYNSFASSPCGCLFLAHLSTKCSVSFCDPSMSGVRRPCVRARVRASVNNFFKLHLLWNRLLDFDQTSQEWSLGGPLSKLFKPFQLVA